MNNYILGTAGHIDHGKTALIKALTNIDCDTHPQEKTRGITINLGFSFLKMQSMCAGIIDVPGHSDFINTMVSGAFAIDAVLLVIAADAGIMPQTREHLQILEILGIKNGLVVLTKTDLVDEEIIKCVREEITTFLNGSFLENCEIVQVSSKTGSGIENLKIRIEKLFYDVIKRESFQNFRLYIDRIFSVHGYGTVVTGSTLGGEISVGDKLYLFPEEKQLKIRRMELYGKEISTVSSRTRVAINITGLEKKEFKKGMVLTSKKLEQTQLLDTRLSYIIENKTLQRRAGVIFLTGTFETRARLHLLDTDKLCFNETGFAQIHLETPCILVRGDKFIIRNSSGERTLGGGEVLDAYPLHHRRRRNKVIKNLKLLNENKIENVIYSELQKGRISISLAYLSQIVNKPKSSLETKAIFKLSPEINVLSNNGEVFFILKTKYDAFRNEISKLLKKYHSQNPLDPKGRSIHEFLNILNLNPDSDHEQIIFSILDEMIKEKKLKIYENTYILSNHSVKLSEKDKYDIKLVEIFTMESGYHVANDNDLEIFKQKNKISEQRLYEIFNLLLRRGMVYCIQGSYINSSIVNHARELLLGYLLNHPDGVTVANFRDLLKGNRKICLLLLNLFDKEGITFREGDCRKITSKGLKLINEK